jgi:hypothetical protein
MMPRHSQVDGRAAEPTMHRHRDLAPAHGIVRAALLGVLVWLVLAGVSFWLLWS